MLLIVLAYWYGCITTFNHVKRNNVSKYPQIFKHKDLENSPGYRISFPVTDLWKTAGRFSRFRQPFPSRVRFSIFPLSAFTVTAKIKGAYTREIGYKEQTERNRCNWGRSRASFLSFSLRFSWDSSFPREIVSKKMAKITSDTALFSTGSVNLYIYTGRPFIHGNVNPFLFRSDYRSPSLPLSSFFLSVFPPFL